MARKDELDKPFEKKLLNRAKRIVSEYSILIDEDKDNRFIGTSIQIPSVFAVGKSAEECYKATQDALVCSVATMLEQGFDPPEAKNRTQQINVRLTPVEKVLLSTASKNLGFKGVSDFVRYVALEKIQTAI